MKFLSSAVFWILYLTVTFSPLVQSADYEFASIELLVEQEVGRRVLPQIYKNIGITIDIDPLPAPRAQQAASTGAKAGEIMRIWTYGQETPNTIRVPTPYYYLETMPFIVKGSGVVINSQADLAKYQLSKVRGVKHTDNITRGLNNFYEVNSTKRMFTMLRSYRVDAVLTNTLDGELILTKLGYDNIEATGVPLARLDLYHYIHKDYQHLVPLVDEEIKRLTANGELAQMIDSAEQYVIRQALRR
ncbi:transporter substrate-binding domain-containing protein [Thalassotalea sp. LPB0316]|uniref:substrate-binding periplasmic protein n=1 Tax=Thalassotalea sp. LPB0316 TaxID=2769490 RepID=UPI001868F696|nr:transporter substrate-binding domain-containing protein [Thalassotalea sp. LPB0316]QOL24345.1 transporter substrate-binding domain-containing protein [Thalassotalea sp. LPB0316]